MYSGASMITEYNDDPGLSPNKSKEDIYANRLQARIKELKKTIKANKPVIDQLKAQRRFFKKICEKQRDKIQGISIDLIKQEYEREIESLQQDRFRLQDMITLVHEQSNKKVAEYLDARNQLKENQNFLMKSFQEIEKQNLEYERLISLKNRTIDELSNEIKTTNLEIKNKQNVERKYKEALIKIKQLQKGKSQ